MTLTMAYLAQLSTRPKDHSSSWYTGVKPMARIKVMVMTAVHRWPRRMSISRFSRERTVARHIISTGM